MKARFKRDMKDFEWRNPPTFSGGSDVMVMENWLHRIKRIFIVIRLKEDVIWTNAASFQFIGGT